MSSHPTVSAVLVVNRVAFQHEPRAGGMFWELRAAATSEDCTSKTVVCRIFRHEKRVACQNALVISLCKND